MRNEHFEAGHQKGDTRSIFQALREAEGPSDEDLTAIEAGSESAGNYYTPERLEEFRQMGESIDPNYSKIRRARKSGFGESPTTGALTTDITGMLGRSAEETSVAGSSAAQRDMAENLLDLYKSGETTSTEGAPSQAFDDDSAPSRSRAFPASQVGAGEDMRIRESSFTRARQSPDVARRQRANVGALLLREAGRCDSKGCQLLRATGLALAGQTNLKAGSGIESQAPAIPSRPATAAERKTGGDVKPLDPNHPEYVALKKESQGMGNTLFFPEDALAHNHADEGAHLAYVQQRISGLLKGQGEYND